MLDGWARDERFRLAAGGNTDEIVLLLVPSDKKEAALGGEKHTLRVSEAPCRREHLDRPSLINVRHPFDHLCCCLVLGDPAHVRGYRGRVRDARNAPKPTARHGGSARGDRDTVLPRQWGPRIHLRQMKDARSASAMGDIASLVLRQSAKASSVLVVTSEATVTEVSDETHAHRKSSTSYACSMSSS